MTQLANALATKPGDSSFIQGFHTWTEAWAPHTQISEYHKKKLGGRYKELFVIYRGTQHGRL